MPRASAADAAETARRILETATAHFAEHGYASCSVDDLARAAGVTRGAVYHHYASKPGLFAAVATRQQQSVAEAIVAATRDSTPETALREEPCLPRRHHGQDGRARTPHRRTLRARLGGVAPPRRGGAGARAADGTA